MAGSGSLAKRRLIQKSFELQMLEGRRMLTTSPATIVAIGNPSETGPTTGSFRVSRTDSTDSMADLTVVLGFSGTATSGSDYTLSIPPTMGQVSITIPAATQSAILTVTPIDDARIEGTETVIATIIPPDGTTYTPDPSASLSILDNDRAGPPVARILNSPYSVAEGSIIKVKGSATVASTRTISEYDWDFDYDGTTFNTSVNGANPQFSAAGLDGVRRGTPVTIALRVIDSSHVASAIATATVNVTNAPPTATLEASTVKLGAPGTVTFTSVVDSPADVVAGFIYRYDFNNDGVTDLASHKASATVPASYLSTVGTHIIHGIVRDKDDGISSYPVKITVIANKSTRSRPEGLTGAYNPIFSNSPMQGPSPRRLDDLNLAELTGDANANDLVSL